MTSQMVTPNSLLVNLVFQAIDFCDFFWQTSHSLPVVDSIHLHPPCARQLSLHRDASNIDAQLKHCANKLQDLATILGSSK